MIIALMAVGFMAQAQTSSTSVSTQQSGESTAKIQDLQKKDQQMKDIDQEITNAKMRAELGSKSKWSVRTSMSYSGGTIQKAFSEERPNITQGANSNDIAQLGANVAVKYRTTDRTSLNAGVGISIYTPFHRTFDQVTNSNTKNAYQGNGKLTSVSDPYLEFNYASKMGEVQNFASISGYYATDKFETDTLGLTSYAALSDQMIYALGNSSFGIAAEFDQNAYKDTKNTYLLGGVVKNRADSGFYAVPFYEYAFNDTYNFRTVFNWFNFQKVRAENQFRQLKPQQSVGLGISVTRDVFLYPNVQFIPQDIRADRTNVGLSANINVF